MARIRSVHPSLFTDEAFACLTSDSQVLLIGLWTEADDQGIFEWKTLTLRMRLRPAKDGSIDGLLSEIEDADCITSYEINSRKYGAIRNFRKYQRPKSPNAIHPINDDIRKYVGLSAAISEMDVDKTASIPPDEEIDPQREEGGDNRRGRKKETSDDVSKEKPVRGSRISGDWEPSPEDRSYAESVGLAGKVDRIAADFRDWWHAKSGQGGVKLDWPATWRQWCRKEADKVATGPSVTISGKFKAASADPELAEILRNRADRGEMNV